MPKYKVTLQSYLVAEETVEADTHKAAVIAARNAHPGFIPFDAVELSEDGEELSDYFLAGTCEWCEEPIFDDEEYAVDNEEGHYCCSKCLEAIETKGEP